MFTGLVEDLARVTACESARGGLVLTIEPRGFSASELALGESVSVNGTCLTVTAKDNGNFRVELAPETVRRTTLGQLNAGAEVNLERAVRPSDRLGGHIVTGHIDGVGEVIAIRNVGDYVEMEFRAPPELARYLIAKGSVAIDGVSLTVCRVQETTFDVALIPHTLAHTTLGKAQIGTRLNMEMDLVGKYVERFVSERGGGR